MMRTMTSSVGTSPARLTRQISDLKQRQDNTTARMGSDTVGTIGTADPDFYGFVTDTFKTMKPVTVRSGNGIYSTLAILPDQQHATLEDRYYAPGTAFVMDRAGTANVGFNILRSGPPPAGYFGGQKLMVQKRAKRYFRPDPGDGSFCFRWEIADVRDEPKDYVLQEDERLDGDFYPGSIYRGLSQAYGWTFPTGDTGGMLYNSNPYGSAAWSGAVNVVPSDTATKPVINSITPNTYEIGSGSFFVVDGTNFTGAGFVMFGPFLPSSIGLQPDPTFDPVLPDGIYVIPPDIPLDHPTIYPIPGGAGAYRFIQDDNTILLNPPTNPQAGTFDIIVVGADGQIGRLENGFTITEAV